MGRTVTHRPRNLPAVARNSTTRMVSQIDTTVPIFGSPTTDSVRQNFAYTKDEIEDLQTNKLGLAGGEMAGPLLLFGDPTEDTEAATKRYVDSAATSARSEFMVNVFDHGAVGDNIADDQPAFLRAIRAAIDSGLQLVCVPATSTGYRLGDGLVLEDNVILVGNLRGGGTPIEGFGTTLNFDNGVATCITLDGGAGNLAQGLKALAVLRSGGAPPAGSVGIFVTSSYNVVLEDVTSFNHAKPWRWYADGQTGLSTMVTRCFSGAAADVHVEIDSWPELRFSQCRFGRNGLGDYNCTAYVRITGGQPDPAPNPGVGPNTIHFENCHFNQGVNQPQRWVTFDNMAGGGFTATIYSFRGCHVEACLAGIGSNTNTGLIYNLSIAEVIYNTPGEFLDLDPNTQVSQLRIVDSFLSGNLTLTPTAAIDGLKITSSTIGGVTTITGAGTASTADLIGNSYLGGLVLAGPWMSLNVLGGSGGVTNNATGVVALSVPPHSMQIAYRDGPLLFTLSTPDGNDCYVRYVQPGGTPAGWNTGANTSGVYTIQSDGNAPSLSIDAANDIITIGASIMAIPPVLDRRGGGWNDTFDYNTDSRVWLAPGNVALMTLDPSGMLTTRGPIILPSDPISEMQAATKQYIDVALATGTLYQGPWQVGLNQPDLATATLQGGFRWLCVTADPAISETPPIAIPGLTGKSISDGAFIIWDGVLGQFTLIATGGLTKIDADSLYLPISGDAERRGGQLLLLTDGFYPLVCAATGGGISNYINFVNGGANPPWRIGVVGDGTGYFVINKDVGGADVDMLSLDGINNRAYFNCDLLVDGTVACPRVPTLGTHLTNKDYVDSVGAPLQAAQGALKGNLDGIGVELTRLKAEVADLRRRVR
jgi:hypothetical protein